MYQNIVLNDLLEIIEIMKLFSYSKKSNIFKKKLNKKIRKMITWMLYMQHPDGHISFFNDSSIGIAPDSKYILNHAQSLGIVYKKN